MSARGLAAGLVAYAAIALIHAGPARAACPAPPADMTGRPFLVTPHDGDVAVPANSLLLIHWPDPPYICENNDACLVDFHHLALRDAAGQEVGSQLNSYRTFGPEPRQTREIWLVPRHPLTAATHYTLVWVQPGGTEEVLGAFTAGPTSDEDPPARPVITGVEVGPLHNCGTDDFGCCVDTPVRRITLKLAPVSEPVLYSTTFFGRDAVDQPVITGLFYCDARPQLDFLAAPGVVTPFVIGGGAHEVGVTAVSPIGRGSETTTIAVFASCDPNAPDAGPIAPPPADAAPDASITPAEGGDGGCAVGVTRPRGPGVVLGSLFALIALGRLRRANRWRRDRDTAVAIGEPLAQPTALGRRASRRKCPAIQRVRRMAHPVLLE